VGRAVPRGPVARGGVLPSRPLGGYYSNRYGYPYRYGYGYPYGFYRPYYYYPGFSFGFTYGYPYYGWPYYYGSYAYGYPYGYGGYGGYPGYGYSSIAASRPYGAVRIDIPQRDAEVYVDGYFAGIVDDFDGTFQHVNLEVGAHHIELRSPDFETIGFDVNVEPGRTITYRSAMRPRER
jgi:hypothetical protein